MDFGRTRNFFEIFYFPKLLVVTHFYAKFCISSPNGVQNEFLSAILNPTW